MPLKCRHCPHTEEEHVVTARPAPSWIRDTRCSGTRWRFKFFKFVQVACDCRCFEERL